MLTSCFRVSCLALRTYLLSTGVYTLGATHREGLARHSNGRVSISDRLKDVRWTQVDGRVNITVTHETAMIALKHALG